MAKRRKSDLLRDQEHPTVLGYELDRKTLTPIRSYIDTSKPATISPTEEDRRLLAQYGSLEALEAAGFYGSADKLRNARESNPFRLSTKDPSDMSAAEINRELDRISAEDSKVNQEFIDAGRGHEKYWDILKKDDPLSRKALALASRRHKLKIEIERRAGPGMSRLPRGFGPRKSNPVKKRANDLTAQALEGYNGEPLKYLYSSPSWYAYKIGEHFRASGRPEPSDVRMGRGYSINVRDMTFSFGKKDAITRVK